MYIEGQCFVVPIIYHGLGCESAGLLLGRSIGLSERALNSSDLPSTSTTALPEPANVVHVVQAMAADDKTLRIAARLGEHAP